jgi:hypothetical protein
MGLDVAQVVEKLVYQVQGPEFKSQYHKKKPHCIL